MNNSIKKIIERSYKPILTRYLSSPRMYAYKGIRVKVLPGVFHPGFFYSTKILLRYLLNKQVEHKTFLELGAGSGLISLAMARKDAKVTALDINPQAIGSIQFNAVLNRLSIDIIHSDLFEKLTQQVFDIIAINPPYYKKDPESYAEHAWYCGAEGQYFKRLFGQLGNYSHTQSLVCMILSENCDLDMVNAYASNNNFLLEEVDTCSNLLETNHIYQIKRKLT